ncbi:MAG: hypothetical protein Q4A54_01870 [Parabacteroides sp.]|nr:hypothetical protein [Parabacteroides sp.]
MKENFARAKELELRVKGFIVGSIVAPLIMIIISKVSNTPMTMNYGTAMMTGILIIVVSLLVAFVFSQAEPE